MSHMEFTDTRIICWHDVKGYEGLYEINDEGKVRKIIEDGVYKMMKPVMVGATREYKAYSLTKDHVTKLHYVHRLILEVNNVLPTGFNPDGTEMKTSPEVNHIDGNTRNNDISNLEWCDRYYNNKHRRKWTVNK